MWAVLPVLLGLVAGAQPLPVEAVEAALESPEAARGSIEVEVRDGDTGAELEGMAVVFRRGEFEQTVLTGPDGTVALVDVLADTWTVEVSGGGYGAEVVQVDLSPGTVSTVRLFPYVAGRDRGPRLIS